VKRGGGGGSGGGEQGGGKEEKKKRRRRRKRRYLILRTTGNWLRPSKKSFSSDENMSSVTMANGLREYPRHMITLRW